MATAEEMAKAVAEGTHPGGDVLRVALRERRTSATVWLTGDKHALRLMTPLTNGSVYQGMGSCALAGLYISWRTR